MRYDLNFWPAIDWKRESSIDPRFLAGVAFCCLLLGVFTAWSFEYSSTQAAKAELQRLKAEDEKIRDTAAEVQRQLDCIKYWKEMQGRLQHKELARMPWSNILALLHADIPENVVLQAIAVSSQTKVVEVMDNTPAPKSGTGRRVMTRRGKVATRLQYSLTISGTAVGENAEDTITRFSRIHQNSKTEFASFLEEAELTNMEPEFKIFEKTPSRRFVIVCRLKPVDWYGDPTQTAKNQ